MRVPPLTAALWCSRAVGSGVLVLTPKPSSRGSDAVLAIPSSLFGAGQSRDSLARRKGAIFARSEIFRLGLEPGTPCKSGGMGSHPGTHELSHTAILDTVRGSGPCRRCPSRRAAFRPLSLAVAFCAGIYEGRAGAPGPGPSCPRLPNQRLGLYAPKPIRGNGALPSASRQLVVDGHS